MNNCTNMHKRHQRNRSTVFSATAIKKGIVFELEGCSLASTCGTFSICMLRYCIAWKTCKHNLHILHVSPTVGRCWHIMAYVGLENNWLLLRVASLLRCNGWKTFRHFRHIYAGILPALGENEKNWVGWGIKTWHVGKWVTNPMFFPLVNPAWLVCWYWSIHTKENCHSYSSPTPKTLHNCTWDNRATSRITDPNNGATDNDHQWLIEYLKSFGEYTRL